MDPLRALVPFDAFLWALSDSFGIYRNGHSLDRLLIIAQVLSNSEVLEVQELALILSEQCGHGKGVGNEDSTQTAFLFADDVSILIHRH